MHMPFLNEKFETNKRLRRPEGSSNEIFELYFKELCVIINAWLERKN